MKKLYALLLISITSVLLADHEPGHRHDNKKQEVYVTPEAAPLVTKGADFFFTADYIYWTCRINGLDYARSGYQFLNIAPFVGPMDYTDVTEKGDTRTLPSTYDSGFKVGAGLTFKHDGWDLLAEYTWFRSSDRDSVSDGNWVPLWNIGNYLFTDQFSSTLYVYNNASSTWKLDFDTVDLELGRNFYISHFLKLRPHFGLKGTWQKQDYTAAYNTPGQTNGTSIQPNPTVLDLTAEQKYWGVGLRAGLDTSWQFNHNFGFFGDLSLAGLCGKFTLCRKDHTVLEAETLDTADTIAFWSNRDFYQVNPVLELMLGFRCDWWSKSDNYHFAFQAGWEEQVWFDMNQFIYFLDADASNGNMSFQGLDIKFRFDF